MADKNRDVMEAWFERVWNRGELDAIDQLRSPSTVAHGIAAQKIEGIDEFKQFVRNVREVFPVVHARIEDSVSEGDKLAIRVSLELARAGKTVRVTGMGIARIVDGKILEGWNLWDVPTLLAEIGAAPRARNMGEAVALAAQLV